MIIMPRGDLLSSCQWASIYHCAVAPIPSLHQLAPIKLLLLHSITIVSMDTNGYAVFVCFKLASTDVNLKKGK
jgi:hypothetical protein